MRRLRYVGFLGREGTNDMTEEPTVLVLPGRETPVLRALAEALRPHLRRGRWDLAFFHLHVACPGARPLHDGFVALRSRTWMITERKTGSFVTHLPDTWAEYRSSLTRSMRDNFAYYPRLLTRHGHAWSIRTVRDPGEMKAAAERLAGLHRARAGQSRGRGHTDHIHSPVHREFLESLMRRLALERKAFIAELVVGDEVVASQAFFERGGELMVYYSGYLESWYAYSPIFILETRVFQEAQARGVRRLNFLQARAAWKTRWSAVEGPAMHRLFLAPLRPMSILRVVVYFVGILWKRDVVGRIPRLRRKLAQRLLRLNPLKRAKGPDAGKGERVATPRPTSCPR